MAAFMDQHLRIADVPDYAPALNGVQVAHRGPVTGIAAAVDVSLATIDGTVAAGANLLIVHHGLFWGGLQPLTGRQYQRVHRLIANDVALYAAHLPLDVHETHGNSRLLARELGLVPTAGFARYRDVDCGVCGESDTATSVIHASLERFASTHGGRATATRYERNRITRRWGICSGSGASQDTLREALARGIDTLIVGEGPHWSAVDAQDSDLVILYGGHYATETPGVAALAEFVSSTFDLPWSFVAAPTGL
jgi:dinuclear metal center YbgI/SA1388 family protein